MTLRILVALFARILTPICFLVLAGCTQATPPLAPAASADRPAGRPNSGAFRTIYSFRGGADGAKPVASMTVLNGNLYGTTYAGGGSKSCYFGCGTVFEITPSGQETVLHQFGLTNTDGLRPNAALIAANGVLYGTTVSGGANQRGTVFSITPSGTEQVVYSFHGGTDGRAPWGTLLDVNNTLYGTTELGGTGSCTFMSGADLGCGTAFGISLDTNSETVLYSFQGGADGVAPISGLVNVNGVLYGTTATGGAGPTFCKLGGCGTVFSLTLSGVEHVVFAFPGASNGSTPYASLTVLNGLLYGTTKEGARKKGTIFRVTTSGTQAVVHRFGSAGDGVNPESELLAYNGTLYGTTSYSQGGAGRGDGTVYSISPSGQERVLHVFGTAGGAVPVGGLVELNGTLYGTTLFGGAHCTATQGGCGTVFAITP